MAQPGMPSARGEDAMIRRIQDLERKVQENAAANIFGLTGIRPKNGGTEFDGYVTVNGLIVVNGASTFNGPLVVNGVSTFNGAMSVTGTLSLPAGIIDNAALTDPVVLETAGLSQNNFGTTTGGAVYAQAVVPVPAGYTRASVVCMVVAGAVNNTGSLDYLYAASSINGVNGGETPESAVASGGYASTAANGIRTLTGLSGGSITLGCHIRTGAAWAANTSNFANMNAFIYFRR